MDREDLFEDHWSRGRKLPGWFSDADARLLWESCEEAAAGASGTPRFVEVGSYRGRSSTLLMGHGAMVLLVEPFWLSEDRRPGDDGTAEVGYGYISRRTDNASMRQLERNLEGFVYLLMPHPSDFVAPMIGAELDLVFIDGDHGRGGVDVDAELWLPKLRPGGLALFHDYEDPSYPTVSEVVRQLGWPHVAQVDNLVVLKKP